MSAAFNLHVEEIKKERLLAQHSKLLQILLSSIEFLIAFCVMLDLAIRGWILALCFQQMVLLH